MQYICTYILHTVFAIYCMQDVHITLQLNWIELIYICIALNHVYRRLRALEKVNGEKKEETNSHFLILWFSGSTRTSDLTVTSSDVNYVIILIVRPLALVATFLAAYGVRHFYPNVYCYEWTSHVHTICLSPMSFALKQGAKLHWAL